MLIDVARTERSTTARSAGRVTRAAIQLAALLLMLVVLFPLAVAPHWQARAAVIQIAGEPAYKVEYYYKIQWGHADEWLALFRKNHLPLLKALTEQGRITELEIAKPRYHATEDSRWDYRVTITWKNFAATNDPAAEQAIIRKLFPDQETFKREERRRFEIIQAHWDLPVVGVSLEP